MTAARYLSSTDLSAAMENLSLSEFPTTAIMLPALPCLVGMVTGLPFLRHCFLLG